MRIELLGPLSGHIDGVSIVPGAAKPCQVLALLAVNAEQPVSKAALCEELWGHRPPATATTLHTYIHQLRRHIDRALGGRPGLTATDILKTERNGYSLRLHGGDTDVREFHRLSKAGTAAYEDGDMRTASRLLGQALGLWRSAMLADIYPGPLLTLEALTLDDARVAALNRRIEADLRLGRHLEITGELRTLTIQHPVNETFAAHYMVSLYHSGRVGKALEEYQRIRSVLIEELGIEPSSRIARLQNAILTGEPALAEPALPSAA